MTTLTSIARPSSPATHDHDDAHNLEPLKFERRCVDRWPVHTAATAFCLSGDTFGQIHDLTVNDYSTDGLGATSRSPMQPGEILSIGFQAPGRTAKRGVVLRCTPCGHGYRVAVQFEARMAA